MALCVANVKLVVDAPDFRMAARHDLAVETNKIGLFCRGLGLRREKNKNKNWRSTKVKQGQRYVGYHTTKLDGARDVNVDDLKVLVLREHANVRDNGDLSLSLVRLGLFFILFVICKMWR